MNQPYTHAMHAHRVPPRLELKLGDRVAVKGRSGIFYGVIDAIHTDSVVVTNDFGVSACVKRDFVNLVFRAMA